MGKREGEGGGGVAQADQQQTLGKTDEQGDVVMNVAYSPLMMRG